MATHKRTIFLALSIMTTMGATGASAGGYDQDRAWGRIQAEQNRQQATVEQGRRDGSLTWTEKFSIKRQQARIDQLERSALADGRLDPGEVRAIREAQQDAARHIAAERHDGQVRGWWWRLWK